MTSHMKSEEPHRKLTTLNTVDFLDSTYRNYFVKSCTKISARKTPTEKVSLQKQHETARKALVGKTSPDHIFLFHRGPVPVPAPINNGPHYFTDLEELQKGFEICEDYFLTPTRPYSEKRDDTSKYPGLISSQLWSKDLSFQPPEGSISPRPGSGKSDSEGDDALKDLQQQSFSHEKEPLQNRKHSISVIIRPGSNTKPILPPIPQGRK